MSSRPINDQEDSNSGPEQVGADSSSPAAAAGAGSKDSKSRFRRSPRTRSPARRFLAQSIFLSLAAGLVFCAAYYLARQYPSVQSSRSFANSLSFVLLINLNIIAVMVLGFLVIRNLVKLFLDRRRNILGSRLQTRLVLSFVGLSLIPTCLLFFVAKGILESILSEWLSPSIESSIDGAVDVAKLHYDAEEQRLARFTGSLAATVSRISEQNILLYLNLDQPAVSTGPAPQLRSVVEHLLEQELTESGYAEARLVDRSGSSILVVTNKTVPPPPALPPASARLAMPLLAGPIVRPEFAVNTELMRGYAPVKIDRAMIEMPPDPPAGESRNKQTEAAMGRTGENSAVPNTVEEVIVLDNRPPSRSLILVVTQVISAELSHRLSNIVRSYDDHKELKSYQRPIASSYLLTLIMVTLMIVFVAVWVGFHLARSLSIPIQLLAVGTEQVAHGNLEFQIPEVGDDEISVLVKSFNTMTADLNATQGELVARRRYMETVLDNVGVGVISVDRGGIITTINVAAGEILELPPDSRPMSLLNQTVPADMARRIEAMLADLEQSKERVRSETCTFSTGRGTKHLQLTVTRLVSINHNPLGAVILIDNLTELVRAQRMSAWREVARRIAHEIKNPLTPIQLNAQRIQKRFAKSDSQQRLGMSEEEQQMLLDSTSMIVQQVEILRNLVNEFSQFARMPRSTLQPVDLNEIVEQAAAFYNSAHPEIRFESGLDRRMPKLELDREQMNRVFNNIFDNALAAIDQQRLLTAHESGVIRITSHYAADLQIATLTIADNGIGIADVDKPRLFEPYFSRRRGGTGLGLAIVSSIVADHHGFIRIRDNLPRGTCLILEFPAGPKTGPLDL